MPSVELTDDERNKLIEHFNGIKNILGNSMNKEILNCMDKILEISGESAKQGLTKATEMATEKIKNIDIENLAKSMTQRGGNSLTISENTEDLIRHAEEAIQSNNESVFTKLGKATGLMGGESDRQKYLKYKAKYMKLKAMA